MISTGEPKATDSDFDSAGEFYDPASGLPWEDELTEKLRNNRDLSDELFWIPVFDGIVAENYLKYYILLHPESVSL